MAYPASAAARGVAARSGGFSRTILASCALAALVAGAGYAVVARLEPRETAARAPRAAPLASGLLDPRPAAGAPGLGPFDGVAPSGRFVAAAPAAVAAPPIETPPNPQSAPAPRDEVAIAPVPAAPVAEAAPAFVAPEPPRRPAEFAALAPTRPGREAPGFAARPQPPARIEAVAPRIDRYDRLDRLLPAEAAPVAAPAAPATRQASRRARSVAVRTTAPEQGFFQKLFGGAPQTTGSLAYAPEGRLADDAMRPAATAASRMRLAALAPEPAPSRPAPDAVTPRPRGGRAIYDIAGQVVILPDGTRLEAHSGLGPHRDDIRYKHLRMRGVTPPHVYNLTEREALFHGVRAIRLNPVGGAGAIFGRAGLLAHTYMLGPGGDSNGCVSIRNYQAFLDAFLAGKITQLEVVASLNGSSMLAQR